VLCGERFLENGIGFHEVSYKRFREFEMLGAWPNAHGIRYRV
jgi:hypothetical protein